jgi:hypothetical protein
MGWPATDRYGLSRAPAGLGFVQDVVNTHPTQRPLVADQFADLDSAQRWLDGTLQNWSEEAAMPQSRMPLTEDDLDKLRGLRAGLTTLLRFPDQRHDGTVLPSASLSVRVGPDGTALLEPRGEGSRRVSANVLIEIFTAQRFDTWRRLKICRNEVCSARRTPKHTYTRPSRSVRKHPMRPRGGGERPYSSPVGGSKLRRPELRKCRATRRWRIHSPSVPLSIAVSTLRTRGSTSKTACAMRGSLR